MGRYGIGHRVPGPHDTGSGYNTGQKLQHTGQGVRADQARQAGPGPVVWSGGGVVVRARSHCTGSRQVLQLIRHYTVFSYIGNKQKKDSFFGVFVRIAQKRIGLFVEYVNCYIRTNILK